MLYNNTQVNVSHFSDWEITPKKKNISYNQDSENYYDL